MPTAICAAFPAAAGRGSATAFAPVVGRVSMDLTAICVDDPDVAEGDWVELDYELPRGGGAVRAQPI